jgi:type I secretion system ABC transporter, PrtD family
MGFGMNRAAPGELRDALSKYRAAFLTVALLSAALNMLMLGGSLYMMLLYDSVLPSRSVPTLLGLLAMLLLCYVFQGAFDHMRSQILGRIADAFDQALSHRVQRAMSDGALRGGQSSDDGLGPMRDLESIRSYLSGSGPATLIDLPWIAFFAVILTLIHPWLGLVTMIGATLLVGLTFVTHRVTAAPTSQLVALSARRNAQSELQIRHVETLTALGMRERMLMRWESINRHYLAAHRTLSRHVSLFSGMSRIGRMLLQSVILTVGVLLVMDGSASSGAIFAASILSARALAPVDQAIANWKQLAAARLGWERLSRLLETLPAPRAIQSLLPAPRNSVEVCDLFLAAPGSTVALVKGVDFRLAAGDALAIIGPSAAGKSSLGRAIVGVWRAARGSVRLDGASLDQWPAAELGRHIGYLPQSVDLFAGSVAENIARFDENPDPQAVIAAAQAAGVHDMIVALSQGYETQVGMGGSHLSGGQQQRIALARALYGDPLLVLLDEPNSNLDAEGDAALERAVASVRLRGGIAILISHRVTALAHANRLLLLRDGVMEDFGPRDDVLKRVTARMAEKSIPRGPAVVVGAKGQAA